jgi:hypothetical protein
MRKTLKNESNASTKLEGKAEGIGSHLAQKVKARLSWPRKGNNLEPNSSPPDMHKPIVAVPDGSQEMRFNAEDSNSHHPTTAERENGESKAIRKSNNEKDKDTAYQKDDKFPKQGPPELTNLYRPLSMNMSKTRKEGEEAIESCGRYQFEDLDFSSMQFLATLKPMDAQSFDI